MSLVRCRKLSTFVSGTESSNPVCSSKESANFRSLRVFHPKLVAILYDITQDALRAEADLMRELAGKTGFEIVAFEAFRVKESIESQRV